MPSSLAAHWDLDPDIVFLNHGSFGAAPRAVLRAQDRWRARMEREPVRFFARELDDALAAARAAVGRLLGADPDDLAFVPNATAGVNTVLRSLRKTLTPGDELLVTDHAYNACKNALLFAADECGARVVVARVPFPIESADQVVAAILAAATERTRLALVDHVTSPTGLVWPIERIVGKLAARRIDTLVDGAHVPGMLPLDLGRIGAAYYTGNFHKWLCAPKGAGFLHVRRDRQAGIRPLCISHGATRPLPDRPLFRQEFDWTGTDDPTPYLCVPDAIAVLDAMTPPGIVRGMEENRALAIAARALLCEALGVMPPAPESMLGSLAAVPLPAGDGRPPRSPLYLDPLQDTLLERFGIEVPIAPWPAPPHRLLRISAQRYNSLEDYDRLARALHILLAEEAP